MRMRNASPAYLSTLSRAVMALCGALATLAVGVTVVAAQTDPCQGYKVQNITLKPILPTEFFNVGEQPGADCMAWQTFITLNWAADPKNPGHPDPTASPSSFGTPGDTTQKVWESFLSAPSVFNPPSLSRLVWFEPRSTLKLLTRTSKLGAADLSLSGIKQAKDGRWVTDQAGGLTYYEVRLNQDEFEFITTNVFAGNDLTTFAGQAACASQASQNSQGGFNLPAGGGTDTDCLGNPKVYGQNHGAIEIKAAWIALPSDHSLDYRYKTAVAQITAPDQSVSTATVGLVGLHIIHKVPGAPQFLWATFEQIDNDPDDADGGAGYSQPSLPSNPNQKASPGYTYFNVNCTAASDPTYKCQHNDLPGNPCDAKGKPDGCFPYGAPMQITRLVPTDSAVYPINGYAWSVMPPKSVFNYYRLINVQWPGLPTPVKPGSHTPLSTGGIQPDPESEIVANTTMETYQQNKNACMSCHQAAPIGAQNNQLQALIAGRLERKVRPIGLLGQAATPFASDYSFIFLIETVH